MQVEVNNIKLNYEKYGNGEKAIIFLHGNGEDLDIFKNIVKLIPEKYTVYLVDSRCHGNSTNTKELHYNDIAEDITQFIIKLKLDKPVLFGFSDGGNAGLIIAGKTPTLLSKLIIAGANMYPTGMKSKYLLPVEVTSFFHKSPKLRLMVKEPNITKEFLHKIEIPTLVIAGSKDMIRESHTKKIARNIRNSKLKILEGENHSSYVLNNEKLYEAIKEYL